MAADVIWREHRGDGPIVAAAIHAGHDVRGEVAGLLAVSGDERLREEDPFTDLWTQVAPSRLIGLRSRFEVDLNRPREKAVYLTPQDAWGLNVWRRGPEDGLLDRSLGEYDAFYAAAAALLGDVHRRHGRFVVLDLHSYNHRRSGPGGPPADPRANPQVNIGTGTMDRARWAPVVDRLIADLSDCDFPGGRLDVRENVKFKGGHFAGWIHETFPAEGCAPAIEFKKFFMDEWTGEPDAGALEAITEALRGAVPGILEELERL
jgi:N-formylglutamate amidohydrolase